MTRFTRRLHATQDDGAVLLLALVILGAVALVVSALVTQLGTHFLVTQKVNARANQLYAADAGLRVAVDTLQQEMSGTRSHCLDVTGGTQSVATLASFNNDPVSVTCQTLEGSASSSSAVNPLDFALITTDLNKTTGSLRAQSGSSSYTINGAIYLGGGVDARTGSGGDIDNNLTLPRGDVGEYTRNCPTITTPSSLRTAWDQRFQTTVPPYQKAPVCLAYTPDQVAPSYTLPTDPDIFGAADPPVALTGPSCTIFFPGRYTTPPSLAANNYFSSGLYYFDFLQSNDTVTLGPSDTAVFGASSGAALDPASTSACRSDAAALATSPTHPARIIGTGASVILGGASRLSVQGTLQINARTPFPPSGEPVSIYGVRPADTSTDSRWHSWANTTSDYAVSDSGGGAVLHADGAINTYDAAVSIFGSGGANVAARAGVTARYIFLKANSSALTLNAFGVGGGGPGDRTILLTATATGTAGDPTRTVAQAVVRISNASPTYHLSIDSWRTDDNHS